MALRVVVQNGIGGRDGVRDADSVLDGEKAQEAIDVECAKQFFGDRIVAALVGLLLPAFATAHSESTGGGEANLALPDLKSVIFEHFFGLNGHDLLMIGLLFCVGGLLFGLAIYVQLKNLPVCKVH